MNRTTLLTLLVVLLMAVNAVTLYLLLQKEQRRDRRFNPSQLFEKLQLDTKQEEQFEALRKTHFQKRDSLRNEEIRLRKSMAKMLTNGITDSLQIDSITRQLAVNRRAFDLNFYNHFLQLRSLLRPEQQLHFGEVMEMILRRMGPTAGGRPAAPPHP